MSGPVYAGEDTVSKLNGEEFAVRIKDTLLEDRTYECVFRDVVTKTTLATVAPEVLQSGADILAVVRVTSVEMAAFPEQVEWLFVQHTQTDLPDTLLRGRWTVQE